MVHLLDLPHEMLSKIDRHISDATADRTYFRLYVYSEGWMVMRRRHLYDWYRLQHK